METVSAHRADGIWCVCVCVWGGGGGNGEGGRRVGRKRRGEGTGCDVCCTLYTVPKAPEPMMPPFRSSDSLTRRSLARSG